MKNRIFINLGLLIIFIIGVFFISGCASETSSTATSSQSASTSHITEEQKQLEILSTATHAYVDTMAKNWDADAEDDGIVVYPELKDSNDEVVEFSGINLTVDIEIWTTKLDNNYNEVKDRLIYNGTGKINSWKDGNFMFNGGIKVPFDDMNVVNSDDDYGEIIIRIHTPNGKTFEAKEMDTRIKPE